MAKLTRTCYLVVSFISQTHRAVESLDRLDGGLVLLEVHETEAAALAFDALLLRVLALLHLHLAAAIKKNTHQIQTRTQTRQNTVRNETSTSWDNVRDYIGIL